MFLALRLLFEVPNRADSEDDKDQDEVRMKAASLTTATATTSSVTTLANPSASSDSDFSWPLTDANSHPWAWPRQSSMDGTWRLRQTKHAVQSDVGFVEWSALVIQKRPGNP